MLKNLAEFFARRQKIDLIVFSGGMYVGENTSHGASVELFAYGEQPRHRAQCKPFVKEACFFDSLPGGSIDLMLPLGILHLLEQIPVRFGGIYSVQRRTAAADPAGLARIERI